jgi:hypothetical protein
VGDVTSASATYHSVYGPVKLAWKKTGKTFFLNASIPPNTRATINFPPNQTYRQPLNIGSGDYNYTVQLK